MPTTNRARHPKFGTMARLSAAATTKPTGNPAIIVPVMRPRIRPGLNSAESVSVTGTSPPRPKLDRKRNTPSDSTFQDAATRPVKTAKIPTVAWNDVRRPM
jgi:hypothetical protein